MIFSHIDPQPSTSNTLINTTTTNVPLHSPLPGTSATTSATTHDTAMMQNNAARPLQGAAAMPHHMDARREGTEDTERENGRALD